MSTGYTPNVGLGCPAEDDPAPWDATIRATIDLLDSLTPIGAGAIRMREIPSSSLYITVAPASIRSSTGEVVSYAGATITVPASVTTLLWLTDLAVLSSGSTWPSGPYVPLASVVAGASNVTTLTDARIVLASVGVAGRSSISAVSSAYTVQQSDGLVEGNATSAAFTITLPSVALVAGMLVRLIKTDASANTVTVAAASGQTINGSATISLASQWAHSTLISDGSNWVAS